MFSILPWRKKVQSRLEDPKMPSPTILELLTKLVDLTEKKVKQKLGASYRTLSLKPDSTTDQQILLGHIQTLYNLLLQTLGPEIAKSSFETELVNFRKILGTNETYFQLIKILPIPVMESEKLALMSREELEQELRLRIKELEEIQVGLEKTVAQRTHEIAAERNKLSLILSGITDAVIGLDLRGLIISFNKAAEKITNLTAKEALGKPIQQVIKIFDKTGEISPLSYVPLRADGFEGELFHKEGVKIVSNKQSFVNLKVGQIKEGFSVNLGGILTIHDVSADKQLEAMKLDFVSMAAHELRTPLVSIIGYLQILNIRLKDSLEDREKDFLQRSYISAQQLNTLVNNMLSISKIENRTLNLSPKPLDWKQNLTNVMANFQTQANEKNIILKLASTKDPWPKVLADGLQINEVLNNLIENALIYTAAGGQVEIFVQVEENQVITCVKDTGSGIPQDALPHLFTKFYRVSQALDKSSNSKGSGLGLYISKAIVENHQGKIWVQSSLGKGSTFCFSLPKAA